MSKPLTKKRLISIILCAMVLGFLFIRFSQPIKPTFSEPKKPASPVKQSSIPDTLAKPTPVTTHQPPVAPKSTEKIPQPNTPAQKKAKTEKPNKASSIYYQLTDKQKENLANEISITKNGWLVYPYEPTNADGNPNPILKYVPHLDNQGNFHSVSIYDMSVQPAFQLTHAYPIPYTSEFPPITLEKAEEKHLNSIRGRDHEMKYRNKLVWHGDKFTPYYLFECKYSLKYKEKYGRFPNSNKKFDCLINAYTGYGYIQR